MLDKVQTRINIQTPSSWQALLILYRKCILPTSAWLRRHCSW